jgi:hypothetical protein
VETTTEIPQVQAPEIQDPAKPEARARVRTRSRQAPAAVQTAPAEAAPVPSEPSPRLGVLLSRAEQRSYNTAIDEAIQRTENNVKKLAGRRLSQDQSVNLQRVQAFLQQARQARGSDLVTARSLAQRADTLAQDLVRGVR